MLLKLKREFVNKRYIKYDISFLLNNDSGMFNICKIYQNKKRTNQ